jgi:hypothetical protein
MLEICVPDDMAVNLKTAESAFIDKKKQATPAQKSDRGYSTGRPIRTIKLRDLI